MPPRRLLELIKRVLSWVLSLAGIASRLKESIWKVISGVKLPKLPWKAYFAILTIIIVFLYNIFVLFSAKEKPSRPWFFTMFVLLVYMSAVVLVMHNVLRRRRGSSQG